ncbi:MAG: ABC transporter substrate-binding protein [Gemmataceae bacterium]|nr:ABC transporter substrate-binding protein [Gemmataceae bacterium]MCI0737952.1 ABC transporter substrate-binding protein [Gemmataceae bacterium]
MARCFVFGCFVLCLGCGSGSQPAVFFGHVASVSGPDRAIGDKETLGIRLAVKELAEDKDLRLIHVKHSDTVGLLDAFEGQAVRLVALGKVLALYGGNSADEIVRLDRGLVPVVTPLGFLPRGVSDKVFSIGLTPKRQGEALARFLAEEKKIESVHVVTDARREGALAVADGFRESFRKSWAAGKKEIAWTSEQVSIDKETKFDELGKRVPSQARALVYSGSVADFGKLLRELNVPDMLLVYAGPEGAPRETGEAVVYFAAPFALDKELAKTQEFADRFRSAFHEDPDAHAAMAYDGTRLLAAALRRAERPASERLLEELKKTKEFAGLTGTIALEGNQAKERPVWVLRKEKQMTDTVIRYDPKN